ncbi:hypothetical protein OAG24_00335 [bacterium]|nr:hypothetical protein [bacterium]
MVTLSVIMNFISRQLSAVKRAKNLLKDYPTFEGVKFERKTESLERRAHEEKFKEKSEEKSKFMSFLRHKNKKSSCEIKPKTARRPTITLWDFENILNCEGWEFSDNPKKFKNSNSLVKVITPFGDVAETSYTKFKRGADNKKTGGKFFW